MGLTNEKRRERGREEEGGGGEWESKEGLGNDTKREGMMKVKEKR